MSEILTELPRTKGEKSKAVDEAVSNIEKHFGKGSIQTLGHAVKQDVPSIPTGLVDIDWTVLGIGGLPKGRIVEIFGPESGGKTTLALRVIANAQKLGEICALIDAEHAFSPHWADKNGVNVNDLLISQPNSGEEALEIAEELIRSGGVSVIVIDTVSALVPQAELDGEMGESHVGLQARLMSQALRKLTALVNRSQCILIFINQIREKIGVMYGSPETTSGGRALKFYASIRLDVRRISVIKDGDEVIGCKVRVKGAKNKVAAPFQESEIDLLFTDGFDTLGNLVDKAIALGFIEKSGSWFAFKNGDKIGQGKQTVIDTLKNDTASLKQLTDQIFAELKKHE